MKDSRAKRGLIDLLKDSLRKPLAYLSLAVLSSMPGCQIAQVTHMNDIKENKKTPHIVEVVAQHRNYLDDTMPTTTLGQWDLAYQGVKQIRDGFPLNPGIMASGVWSMFFHGLNGIVVPVFYPFTSESRDKIFADQDQSLIKPVPDALASITDTLVSSPIGDTYRTFAGLFSIKSEPFIPRTWTKICYRAKSLVGLKESEKEREEKIDNIMRDKVINYIGHLLPVIHHWASIEGTELYGDKEIARHTPGKGIKLREEYLQGLNLEKVMYRDRSLVIKEGYLNARLPLFHSCLLYPARDAAIIGSAIYPFAKGGNGNGGGGNNGGVDGITGGETGGPGGR